MLLHIYSVNMMKKGAKPGNDQQREKAQRAILHMWARKNRFWVTGRKKTGFKGGQKHSWQLQPSSFNENPFSRCQLFDLDAF